MDKEEEDAEKKPSRKQKSLGLLCQKFLALYPDDPPPQPPIWISLDEVATSLGKNQYKREQYRMNWLKASLVCICSSYHKDILGVRGCVCATCCHLTHVYWKGVSVVLSKNQSSFSFITWIHFCFKPWTFGCLYYLM